MRKNLLECLETEQKGEAQAMDRGHGRLFGQARAWPARLEIENRVPSMQIQMFRFCPFA